MDVEFWHQRWKENQIGFHEPSGNAMLVANFQALSLAPGSRVFVPLCGKTRDIAWLMSQGHTVVGVELSKLAIDQLFLDLATEPEVTAVGGLLRYRARNIEIFVGDLFELNRELIAEIDAVYDRAALVALPSDMRAPYALQLHEITNRAPQLLICFEYDQTLMAGPPFSVGEQEVRRVYGDHYKISLVARAAVAGLLKGICPALEAVWLLK